MKYLIANWKAQMTKAAIEKWLDEFILLINSDNNLLQSLVKNSLTIIIAPPFPFMNLVQEKIASTPNVKIAAQTISNKASGKFTGEVTAQTVKSFCQYSLIGHSERRLNYNETEADIKIKLDQAKLNNIESVLCIRGEGDTIYPQVNIIAYEPIEAIGTGANADIDEVLAMKNKLNLTQAQHFLYGGSIDSNNIVGYLKTGKIDGFLVGTASLDAKEFYQMAIRLY